MTFTDLTSARKLPLRVQKQTREALEPFSDDDVDEDSDRDEAEKNEAEDHGDIGSEKSEDLILPRGLEDSKKSREWK